MREVRRNSVLVAVCSAKQWIFACQSSRVKLAVCSIVARADSGSAGWMVYFPVRDVAEDRADIVQPHVTDGTKDTAIQKEPVQHLAAGQVGVDRALHRTFTHLWCRPFATAFWWFGQDGRGSGAPAVSERTGQMQGPRSRGSVSGSPGPAQAKGRANRPRRSAPPDDDPARPGSRSP